jgi:hypothetical protein
MGISSWHLRVYEQLHVVYFGFRVIDANKVRGRVWDTQAQAE